MTTNYTEVEEKTIRAFLQKGRQQRCCFLLAHPKRRKAFTKELAHFKWLDERYARSILPSVAHTAEEIISLLRRKGAGLTVWVISEDHTIDAQELPLEVAIPRVLGRGMGTILSCIPGKLGFFQGEEMKSERLLENP